MKRLFLTTGVTFVALFAFAATTAFAAIIELGSTTTPLAKPVCPATGACPIILTDTTAVQILSDGTAYPTEAAKTKPAQPGLNATCGGASEAAITVLQPAPKHFFKVVAESPLFQLQPYFGHLVQFVLTESLPIAKGDVISLTVPTWAPLLAVDLSKTQFTWRPSRASGCLSYTVQSAQLTLGDNAQYRCFFNGTRVEYTATEVTSPVPPPVPKKKK